MLTGGRHLSLGNNVFIGDDAYVRAEGGLVIGDNTHISRNVTICTVNHQYEGSSLPYDDHLRHRSVTIGRNVWIGMGANVLPGARIGDGAIIGMGATVAGVVPAYAVVGAPRAVVIGSRDHKRYERLDEEQRFGGPNGQPLTAAEVASFVPGIEGVTPLFVVSTGRSGSTTIARTLSQHPDVTCLHEPRSALIRLSTEWAHRLRDRSAVVDDLRAIYDASVCPGPVVFGESDQNLSVLLSPLLDRAPHARVLWLIRNGRDVVSSAVRKGWYGEGPPPDDRPNVWDDYRLRGDLCGDVGPEEWGRMSAFEKNCWYWGYVNRTIEAALAGRPETRWLRVRLEDLADRVGDVFDLVGVDRRAVSVERHNAGRGAKPNWTTAEDAAFERWCGPGMDRWYPDWRAAEPASRTGRSSPTAADL